MNGRERVLVYVCVCVGNLETVFTLKANANQAETLPVRLLLIVIQFMFIFLSDGPVPTVEPF